MRSCESLPEVLRERAVVIGEKLERDEDRAELARRLTQIGERVRLAEVEAEQALGRAEEQIVAIERGLKRAERSEREKGTHRREVKKAEKKLHRLQHPPSV